MDWAYLDNAATTPIAPEVREAVAPFLESEYGNPSSRHVLGVRAAEALDRARARIARALGGQARDVYFTSGGTEANNMAVLGAARARSGTGRKVVIGATEHPSVRCAAEALGSEGFEVVSLGLHSDGSLDLEDAERVIDEETVVVAQMLVNNEFGTIYPVRDLARLVRARAPRAHLHVDAVQGLGKVELDLEELDVDSMAVSAHKVHGPKGSGALVTQGAQRMQPIVHGGGQQSGVRPGTENVVGAVAFGVAAHLADTKLESTAQRTAELKQSMIAGLLELEGVELVRAGDLQVDAVCAVLMPGVAAEVWQHHLEVAGVMASVGSACQSNSDEVSPALMALGFDASRARRVMRFSFSRDTSAQEIERAIEALRSLAPELGRIS